MRRVAASCVAVVLASCTSYQKSKEYAGTGGALLGGTFVVGTYVTVKSDKISADDALPVMGPLMLVGAAMVVAGLIGMSQYQEHPQTAVPPPPPPPTPGPVAPVAPIAPIDPVVDSKKRNAWSLYQEARTAAYNRDCARVEQLARQVVELDRATFENSFSRDPYIVQCAPAQQPPPPPPPAPSAPSSPPPDPAPPASP